MGKTVFTHIEDGYGRIQLFVRRDAIGEDSHRIFRKLLDLGDFVQATGVLFRTRTGEVSLRVSHWELLSKAVSPLPVVKEQEVDGETVRFTVPSATWKNATASGMPIWPSIPKYATCSKPAPKSFPPCAITLKTMTF